jgi:uncharacterized repeat protein (TIGR01451 family)
LTPFRPSRRKLRERSFSGAALNNWAEIQPLRTGRRSFAARKLQILFQKVSKAALIFINYQYRIVTAGMISNDLLKMTHRQTTKISIKIKRKLCQFVLFALAVCLFVGVSRAIDDPSTGGTIITNRADASYEDESGNQYNTVSQTILITIARVPAINVTPDETASSAAIAPNERITRVFQICNTGNSPDFFLPFSGTISAPATINGVFFDVDDSSTVTPADVSVQFGQTLTPQIAPGDCYGVLFVIDTNSVSPQSQITIKLSARSTLTVPGTQDYASDEGTIINSVGSSATFSSPSNTSLPPVKLIENLPRTTAAPGQILNYTIAFRNNGSVSARQVTVTDDLPVELEYVANTLRLNNRSVTDALDSDEGTAIPRRIEFLISEIASGTAVEIRFQARLISTNGAGSGVVNRANVSAANAPAINTSEAVAIINPVGTVYAGNSFGATRIAGAQITVAATENGAPIALTPDISYAPNAQNINPFVSDGNGNFGFALNEKQTGTPNSPVRYVVTVSALNYRPRTLEVLINGVSNGNNLFTATIRALDGQAVAVANGFNLTSETVQISNLAALVFNIPMFELSTLEIAKSADKQTAEIGDIVSYRVQVRNATAYALRDAKVRDVLPASFSYVEDTAQIEIGGNVRSIAPTINSNELTFPIGDLSAGTGAVLTYRVRIGANASEGEHFNVAIVSGLQPNGSIISTQPSKAGVRVRGGVFSLRQIVIGRVYEDRNGNGQFDKGERPVAGARIYTNNGQSVVTDSAGLYNLPAVGEGSLVISLDPLTVPQSYYLTDDKNRRSSKSWTRLLQTPLGGGSLLRQNFAIAPENELAAVADDQKIIDVNAVRKSQIVKNSTDSPQTPVQIASLKNKIPLGIPNNSPAKNENGKNNEASENKAGTYTVETSETIEPVAPGKLFILSPKTEEVIMSPALSIKARVAKDWKLAAEVNGETVNASNIGETRIDNRNNVTTFSFVGVNLRPGKNIVRLTAVNANGERGAAEEIIVWGRGAVEKLEIVPMKTAVQSGGRESVSVEIRGFDRWGNPAADGQISIETSAGRFVYKTRTENPVETPEMSRRQSFSLENGKAIVELVGDGAAETARLKASAGKQEAISEIRFTPELRPQILVGLGEFSFGRNAPAITTSGSNSNFQSRLSFYFRGRFFGDKNLLTLAYDSQRPLNRQAGRDRFGGFEPLDRAYPIFGDSSQRFEDAQSNSKLFARVDRNSSYAMFGDMETDQQNLQLAGYSRRLTGVKLHLENSRGDFLSLTGARPDTAFARDVFPGGGLSVVRLAHRDVLQGSEVINLEVRDRRNPEVILSRERLVRSVDYNIDTLSGEVFFLRPISAFDYQLNLVQIVAAYEYRGTGATNYVYTGRASRNFRSFGLRFGASYLNQQQGEIGAFQIGGIDAEKNLWNGGKLNFEAAMSNGRFASGVNVFDFFNGDYETINEMSQPRNGNALRLHLDQPLSFFQSRLRAEFSRSTANFYNPFGATVAPGSQRLSINLEMRPTSKRAFAFGFSDERNETRNVSNSRNTLSFLWSENISDKLRASFGFDHRHLKDNTGDKTTDSNLVSAGVEYRPTEKVEIAVKREQNLSKADPTYPNQTTFAANYKLNPNAKLFFTQRLAAAPITPIGDFTGTGFASTGSRNETAFGIETKISRLGAFNGRYQLENGIGGTDSFAVIGLQNRWALNKEFALDGGYERGFLLKGDGKSFNSATVGTTWTPGDGFRTSLRYELRDRNGLGQLFSVGAAGKIGDNWTTLVRAQWMRSNFNNRGGSASNVTAATAYRPIDSDKYALLFSYNHRRMTQNGSLINNVRQTDTRDRSDSLSTDGLYQVNRDLEVYGKFALRFNGNGSNTTAYASALTYSGQFRAQQRLNDYFDVAGEGRWLVQPSSDTFRRSAGAELGYWAIPDVRFGLGYNFTEANRFDDSFVNNNKQFRGGVYFTITTKLANLFDLFGTSKNGLTQDSAAQTNETNQK